MEKMLLFIANGIGKLATVLFYFAIVVSLLLKQFEISGIFIYLDYGLFCIALITTIFALIMYVKDIYKKGFIDKQDLKKAVNVEKENKSE